MTFLDGFERWEGGEGRTGFGFKVLLWLAPGAPLPTLVYGPAGIGYRLRAEVV